MLREHRGGLGERVEFQLLQLQELCDFMKDLKGCHMQKESDCSSWPQVVDSSVATDLITSAPYLKPCRAFPCSSVKHQHLEWDLQASPASCHFLRLAISWRSLDLSSASHRGKPSPTWSRADSCVPSPVELLPCPLACCLHVLHPHWGSIKSPCWERPVCRVHLGTAPGPPGLICVHRIMIAVD